MKLRSTIRVQAASTILLWSLGLGTVSAAAEIEPVIDADRLEAIACEPEVVVLDIRSDKIDGQSRAGYEQGHVPCAIHSDYVKDGWRMKAKGVPGMLPPVDKLEALIGRLGIDDGTHVVIAPMGRDSKSVAAGARVYWTLKLLGHDAVSILDGGTLGYLDKESRPLEANARSPQPKSFTARLRPEMLIEADAVAPAAAGGALVVDYRRRDEFNGLNRNGKTTRAGTLLGAHNLPLEWLTRDNGGYFRSAGALRQIYGFAGIPVDAQQIAFCNTGHNSSLGWFIAHEILGNTDVQLYDGSMAEWSRLEGRPMAQVIRVDD